ncbi:hypothetical protein [Nitriliruptor alkaliphilus]|uniref:hypothetical protein n=1 Tax=Nitriliruptor alkaliphilus TaxID=427918 RepID=UPI0012EDD2D3|nr:hypothetical protein [Nitriliruptor alkaliphilus]
MTMRHAMALAAAAALGLAGCSSDDGPEPDPPVTDDAGDDGADVDGADVDGADDTGDTGDDNGEAGQTAEDRLGEVAIDQSQTHPNGVELTIHSLRVEPNAIFLDIEAFNGASFEILLAAFDQILLTDDTGRSYRFEPPEGNEGLAIEQTGTLEGALAFIGRLAPEASTVTVQFNHDNDGEPLQPADADNPNLADAPSFEFADLPLPNS